MDGILTVAGELTGEISYCGATWTAIACDEGGLVTDDGAVLVTDDIASGEAVISGSLSSDATLIGEITVAEQVTPPTYTGEYEITPTQQAQTIPINGLLAADDITVNPIPSNYGLITWDGSTLTVS